MTTEFSVPEVSCQHCVNAITGEVTRLPGVQNVTVDLGTKRVRVEGDERVTSQAIVEAINEAGYDEVTVLG